jgi:tetratricopeptide (TPR) repeat protein
MMDGMEEETKKTARWRKGLPPLLIVLACVAVFSTSLPNDFIGWDDEWLVTGNYWIQEVSWENIKDILNPWVHPEVRTALGNEFLPIRDFSYMLDHAVWGLNAFGFHLTNLLLHTLACLLLYAVLIRLSRRLSFALPAALLFAVHPLHVESIAWVASRKDVLFAFFYFAGILAWTSMHRTESSRGKAVFFLLTFLFYMLSCTSKYMGTTLPAALLLHDWLLLRPRPQGWKSRLFLPLARAAPFLVFLLLFSKFILLEIASRSLIRDWYGGGFWATFLSNFNVMRTYITEVFFASNQQACLDFPLTSSPDVPTLASALLLAVLICSSLWVLGKAVFGERDPGTRVRLFALSTLFFFAAISPVANVPFPIGTLYAERYLYMPLLGGPLLLGGVFSLAWNRRSAGEVTWFLRHRKVIALAGLGIVLVVYSAKTFHYNRAWKNQKTLWTDVLEKASGNHHIANFSIGRAFWEEATKRNPGERKDLLEKAEMHFRIASFQGHSAFYFDRARIHSGLATVLQMLGRNREAIDQMVIALRENEKNIETYEMESNDYLTAGEWTTRAQFHVNLGQTLCLMGNTVAGYDAKDQFQKAIDLFKKYSEYSTAGSADLDIGNAYLALANFKISREESPESELKSAIRYLSRGLLNRHKRPGLLRMRAKVFSTLASFEEDRRGDSLPYRESARDDWSASLWLNPDATEALIGRANELLAIGYILMGRGIDPRHTIQMAISDSSRAIHLKPSEGIFYNDRGIAYSQLAGAEAQYGQKERETLFKAIEDFEKAIELDSTALEAVNNLGLAQKSLGDSGYDTRNQYALAVENLSKYIDKFPNSWESWFNLGLVFFELGRFAKAVSAFEKSDNITGGKVEPVRVWLKKAKGEVGMVRSMETVLFDLDRAENAMGRGEYALAEALLRKALRIAGDGTLPQRSRATDRLLRARVHLARILSLASVGKVSPEAPSRPVEPEKAAEYRSEALALLRHAVDFGFQDGELLRRETDFDPIRKEGAFQKLLRELEGKRQD